MEILRNRLIDLTVLLTKMNSSDIGYAQTQAKINEILYLIQLFKDEGVK